MQDYQEPRLVLAAQTKLRYRIAIGCAVIALGLIVFANRFQNNEFLISTPAESRGGHTYSRLWFDANESLVGVSQQGAKLTVDRWSGGSAPGTWHVDLSGSDPQWIMTPDLSRVAWISGSTLYCRAISEDGAPKSTPVSIALPPRRNVLALGFPSDGSVAAVFADSGFEQWAPDTGHSLGARQFPSKDVDQAVIDEDYIAVSSNKEGRLMLYRLRQSEDWKQMEESPSPDPPYRLIIPAPGVMATFTLAGLSISGETRNSPGALRSAISHLDSVIASGDFGGIFVLPPKGAEFYHLADADPNSIVTASRNYLGVSGAHGTTVLKLGSENRLTASGRGVSMAAIGLLILAALLGCGGLLISGTANMLKGKKDRHAHMFVTLAPPPPDLVTACAEGNAVLWAGAGLSAQSGFPLRTNFIATVLQVASVEKWIDATRARKLTGLLSRGDGETALTELVAETTRIRTQVVEQYCGIFARFAALSRSHDQLAKIPFAAAITTNYDVLIERISERAAVNVITLHSPKPALAAAVSFLLKLYGQVSERQTLLLSRFEFESSLAHSPAAEVLRQVFETRSVLFVGCSLEGLIADLSRMGLPDQPARKHFAVTGVSKPAWATQAAELLERYGIEVIACDAANIGTALPEFLQKLAMEVGHAGHSLEQVQTQTR